MTIRISEDTVVLVAVVIGIFLLAMMCLACSLNPRELLDGSLFRCCRCCRRRRNSSDNGGEDPQAYDTLNEFIFEVDDNNNHNNHNNNSINSHNNQNASRGFVALSNMQTTMEQVFPDLLGNDEPPSPHPSQYHDVERPLFGSNNGGANAELSEPLL